jgi:hypothetical protein
MLLSTSDLWRRCGGAQPPRRRLHGTTIRGGAPRQAIPGTSPGCGRTSTALRRFRRRCGGAQPPRGSLHDSTSRSEHPRTATTGAAMSPTGAGTYSSVPARSSDGSMGIVRSDRPTHHPFSASGSSGWPLSDIAKARGFSNAGVSGESRPPPDAILCMEMPTNAHSHSHSRMAALLLRQ